jgi:2-amino-4-hydroxy-6-hydroxymethyldihydropteridine diphosphokinase
MEKAWLLVGSNEGDREKQLQYALDEIAAHCGPVHTKSGIYETAAWGINEQPDFLNLVVEIGTVLEPLKLLSAILEIEKSAGRQREVKWGQRTLDVDILMYGNTILHLPELTIPHPYLHLRRFTLVPFEEIAPQLMHPVLHKTIHELLQECPDTLPVKKYKSPGL